MQDLRTAAPLHRQDRLAGLCAVSPIDRRTGRPHRVNGAPLLVFTRSPDAAALDLMRGRDPVVWEARVERLAGAPPG